MEDDRSLRIPGFLFSVASSAQKKPGVPDLALIFSQTQARAAAMFTSNRVKAAPVLLSAQRISAGKARAVVVNSGNANACTGEQGLDDARRTTELVAARLDIDSREVLVASTGVIGQRLNMEGIEQAVPQLVEGLGEDHLPLVARAIMTTDTVPKISLYQGRLEGRPFTVCGIGKGAGMMHPRMATMLVFMMTDLDIQGGALKQALKFSADRSFHRINVDGDTSTNDTVLVLANGRAQNPTVTMDTPEHLEKVRQAFLQVADDLARKMVMDAEGATKFVEIEVRGAADHQEAALAAHTVAESKLVKTAFFGEDANWGRIMAALGRCGARLDPDRVDLYLDGAPLVVNGCGLGREAEERAGAALRQRQFRLTVDLKMGQGKALVYTSDLSLDYVRINADYRT